MDTIQKELKPAPVIAGVSLILMAVTAAYGYGYVFQRLYIPTTPDASMRQLAMHPNSINTTVICFILITVLDIIVSWSLYLVFKKTHSSLSLLAACFRLVYSAMLGASLFFLLAAQLQSQQVAVTESVIMQNLQLFLAAWSLALIVFGCHLCILGILLLKSLQVPKAISYLLLFASLCYLFTNIAPLVIPAYKEYKNMIEALLALPMALGELALAIWLIVKGKRLF